MKYYMAPMEGITGYIYRNAYHAFFHPMDKYFTPFIVAKTNTDKNLNYRERNDVLPEHNAGVHTVPQILTNRAKDFIAIARELQMLGYQEVNLNLGCPSRTVVSKKRGSGFLSIPDQLNCFLEEIFQHLDLKISVKTRIGIDNPEEFDRLLKIYNQYPLEELLIHPRLQKDYYKNFPHLEVFRKGYENSRNPVCYNGDIFTKDAYEHFIAAFPNVTRIMLGRGILSNPGLLQEITEDRPLDKQQLRSFHDRIYRDYADWVSGDTNLLFKMKEFWTYLIQSFDNSEKYGKKIRKAQRLSVYNDIVEQLFDNLELSDNAGFRGF